MDFLYHHPNKGIAIEAEVASDDKTSADAVVTIASKKTSLSSLTTTFKTQMVAAGQSTPQNLETTQLESPVVEESSAEKSTSGSSGTGILVV